MSVLTFWLLMLFGAEIAGPASNHWSAAPTDSGAVVALDDGMGTPPPPPPPGPKHQ